MAVLRPGAIHLQSSCFMPLLLSEQVMLHLEIVF